MPAQLGFERGMLGIGRHQVGDQHLFAFGTFAEDIFAHGGDRLFDARETQQSRFDFLQLDPEATNFDLGIGAAEEFHLAVGQVTAEIPGAVEAVGRFRAPGIGPELGFGFGRIGITAGQVMGAEMDFAHFADAGLFAAFTEQDQLHAVVTAADGQAGFHQAAGAEGRFRIEVAGAAGQDHVGHRALGFGRAVEVDTGGIRRDGVERVDIGTLQNVTHRKNAFERRQEAALCLGHELEHRRHQVDQGHLFFGDPGRQITRLEETFRIRHHDAGAERQRHQHVAVQGIVGQRRQKAVAVAFVRAEVVANEGQESGEGGVAAEHGFGAAG